MSKKCGLRLQPCLPPHTPFLEKLVLSLNFTQNLVFLYLLIIHLLCRNLCFLRILCHNATLLTESKASSRSTNTNKCINIWPLGTCLLLEPVVPWSIKSDLDVLPIDKWKCIRYYSYIKIMAFWDVTPCNLVNLTFYTLRRVTFQNTVTLIHRHNNPTSHNVSILSINPSLIYEHSSLRFAKSFTVFLLVPPI